MSADPIAAEARAMGYVVHRADKVASNGAMSALCSDPPTPIDVRPGSRITWTIADAETVHFLGDDDSREPCLRHTITLLSDHPFVQRSRADIRDLARVGDRVFFS